MQKDKTEKKYQLKKQKKKAPNKPSKPIKLYGPNHSNEKTQQKANKKTL